MDQGFLRTLREELPVMKTAPWSFAAVLLVGIGVGFGVASLWSSGTISTLRERLSFAQDKLQVALANPANPAALLTKSDDKQRHLSDKQKQCLISKFKDTNKDFIAIVISAFPNDEAQKYAADFLNIFLRTGYQSGILAGTPKNYDDIGIIIGLKDPEHPSDASKKFKALIGACIELNERSLRWDPAPGLLSPQFSSIDFNLFVGPRD
jgi:hypothetical protein